MHPAVPWLAVDLPVAVGDMVGVEDAVAVLELVHLGEGVADKRGVDGAVDDRVRDVNTLWTEFAGHALGGSPQRELGAGKGGEKYGRDNCFHLIVHSVSFLLSYERVCSRLTYLDNLLIWIYLYLKCIR